MKKRHLLLGLLALEIAALPVAAQIIKKTNISMPDHVIASEFPENIPGRTRMFVNSNGPFTIISENARGEVRTIIIPEGTVGKQAFGSNAQLPGDALKCSHVKSGAKQAVYKSSQKTARAKGSPISQAVLVILSYDKNTSPKFSVLTPETSREIMDASNCDLMHS